MYRFENSNIVIDGSVSHHTDAPIARETKEERSLDVCHVIDVVLASIMLVFFAPVMIAVALAVYLHDRGPIFFGHSRVGYGGRSFKCLKFRTMVVDSEARLQALLKSDPVARREWELARKLRKDPRVTWLGQFLRVSSLDELPQLFNVLRGEMSLVGPRPIVKDESVYYGRRMSAYCATRPGITGLWQISGRNDTTYRRRVAMDVMYVRRRCVALYLKILVGTVPAVLLKSGAY